MAEIPPKIRDTKTLAIALQKAQKSFPEIKPNAINDYHKNPYADLDQINKAIKPVLSANKLCIRHEIVICDGIQMKMVTTLEHESSEKITSEILLLNERNNMQGLGSAATYAMRYNINALLNLATDKSMDDDGNAASRQSAAPTDVNFER